MRVLVLSIIGLAGTALAGPVHTRQTNVCDVPDPLYNPNAQCANGGGFGDVADGIVGKLIDSVVSNNNGDSDGLIKGLIKSLLGRQISTPLEVSIQRRVDTDGDMSERAIERRGDSEGLHRRQNLQGITDRLGALSSKCRCRLNVCAQQVKLAQSTCSAEPENNQAVCRQTYFECQVFFTAENIAEVAPCCSTVPSSDQCEQEVAFAAATCRDEFGSEGEDCPKAYNACEGKLTVGDIRRRIPCCSNISPS